MRINMRSMLAPCIAALMGLANPTVADTPVTYTDSGMALFQFEVPDFWTLRVGGPREIEDSAVGDARGVARVMGMRPVTDDNVWIGFVSPAGVNSIEGGIRYLQDIDKFLVKDPQVSGSSKATIGGLPAQVIRGTGRRDGRGINFTATVIDLPGNRVAVAVAILRDGADPAYVNDLNDVFGSFRSAR